MQKRTRVASFVVSETLNPSPEATPKTCLGIYFALARSSPNMASYWFCMWGLYLNISFYMLLFTAFQKKKHKVTPTLTPSYRYVTKRNLLQLS